MEYYDGFEISAGFTVELRHRATGVVINLPTNQAHRLSYQLLLAAEEAENNLHRLMNAVDKDKPGLNLQGNVGIVSHRSKS